MSVHWHDDECRWCPCDETFDGLAARAIETKAPLDIALALNAYGEDASTPAQADQARP